MKKTVLVSVLILVCLVIPIFAGCRNGNIPLYIPDLDLEACCIAVGDGSAYSCTDGEGSWWCWGNCNPSDTCTGPCPYSL